ncbi:hypothetical protein BJ138DRAFT_1158899 [Hygrophoropsis aurantiaca]|uniref:Uncharacterized protein n=1 Tax=Hygrophoropsis aurantiaca TaxID=72124 RepID=A0ACB8A4C7_9AGAM|nr:hypothetical protein BJ138DRAFT_1158899 [Hygrophoropsis aurantiaca]
MHQSLVQILLTSQTTYYLTTAAAAAVAYDHVLTFKDEIDLIWNRRWSLVTALYVVARYSGSLCTIGMAAWVICIGWTYEGWINMYLVVNWSSSIFVLAMQAILVIRIYALCNRSKVVLIFLTIIYVLQAIVIIVAAGLIFNLSVMRKYVISVSPALGSVAQFTTINSDVFFLPPQDSTILSVVFDAILLMFALFAFVRHALEARKLDGGWSMSSLVRIIVADHMLYFICYLTWLAISLATNYIESGFVLYTDVLSVFNALAVIAGPRMVISLRGHEQKTRDSGSAPDHEMSTIQFGVREPPAQSGVEEDEEAVIAVRR